MLFTVEILMSASRWLVVFCVALFGFKTVSASDSTHAAELVKKYNIGLCIVATGKYNTLAQRVVESAHRYFCTQHKVTYFVFTDGEFPSKGDIVKVHQVRLGWPFDTLKRFHIYETHRDMFKEMDYLFAIDADMLFVASVGDEILGDLVGTQHPAFIGKRGTYEKNKKSKAYVAPHEGKHYFCGGFYGGKRENFIKLLKAATQKIDADLSWNFIAKWHDESHLNRYFIDHPPTKILSPSYCYPETWNLEFPKKLVALNKNHAEMRQ